MTDVATFLALTGCLLGIAWTVLVSFRGDGQDSPAPSADGDDR
ncbi:MAG: hypothetical protein ACTH0V_17690 [Microbacteriaceae bacterium]